MAARARPLSTRIAKFFAGNAFWYIVLGFFVLQAVWLALSAAYPMAFDERYHFGLIQLHSQQWLPFFTSQPDTGSYGAAVRDPSYLYHWLMSYPYRIISWVTNSQTTQIVTLRVLNVVLFTYALVLYRRILRRVGISSAASHAMLFALTLIPVVPFLAATINYDNLLMVGVAWSTLLALDVLQALDAKRIPLARIAVLAVVLLLTSLIKYPFLPIALAISVFLLGHAWHRRMLGTKTWRLAWQQFHKVAVAKQIILIVLLVASLGLFAERYLVNTVVYHTPVPKCDQVESDDVCLQYGPWQRDYHLAQGKPVSWHPNVLSYTATWIHGMWLRLYFGIGPEPQYQTRAPLFLVGVTSIAVAVLLGGGLVWRWRYVFHGHPDRLLLMGAVVVYGITLFADTFTEYLHTGQAVAINGRYWIPLLPFFLGLSAIAWQDILRKRHSILVGAAVLVLAITLLQGGGAMTYIVRGNDSWYWPGSQMQQANRAIHNAVSPLILGKNILSL